MGFMRRMFAVFLLFWMSVNIGNVGLVNAFTWEVIQDKTAICISWETKYLSGTITEETIKEKLPSLKFSMGECEGEHEDESLKTKATETNTWATQKESKKVEICKVQPNWKEHTQEVASEAIDSILKDWKSYLGECKNEIKEEKNNNKITWEKWCHWIDQYGRERGWENKQWRHTDMVSWSEPLELYLICPEKDNYSKDSKSPWCQNIEKQYKLKDSKNISAPWFARKLANCRAYWVPYNKPTIIKWLEEYEEELKAKWNIILNSDSVFSESQNLIVQLNLDTTPDYIAFSEDWENFWDWINYENSVIDYRLKDNSEWVKTVYFKYKVWSTESDITYDKILLLNKYWASYTILSNWLDKKQNYKTNKNYKFTLSLTNKWYYNWDNSENPVRLTYKIYDENNQEVELATNYWILAEEVWYNKTTQTDIIVRIPEQSWKYKVEFSLEHFGYTNFKDAWVTPLVKEVEVINSEIQSRQIIQNKESLPFGIGNYYAPLNQEEVPNDIVVCEDSTNIYSLTASWTVFSLEYRAPYLTNVTTPRIHDIWLDTQDNTSFFEISYDDKIPNLSFDDHFFIYKNSVELSNICSADSYDFGQRRCEEEFSDMASSSDMDCFTAYTVSSKDWFSGYKDWTFKWENTMNRAEYAKVLVNASQKALIPYREWSISDIQGTDEQWWSDYAQTVVDNNLMELSNTWAFFPLNDITYMDAIKWSLNTFNFDMQNNTCDYTIIKPDNTYLGVALFFGLIDKTSIPNNPYTDSVDRLTVAKMMLNAYHQEASLKNASDFCPKSSDDVFETYTKEICASDKKAVLSTTQNLNKDWIELNNWTEVEILEENSSITKIRVIWLDEEGYISNNELAETCTIPTPKDELKTPEWNEVVVSSLVGIYAHENPSATSWYFDYNKDWNGNNQDVIPYNTVLTVLETKWNWFKVEFQDQRTAWIFNWFVAIWPDVEIFTPETKITWTISWDYWVTVDLRANTNTDTKENIIWETYEDTKVQILWKDETNNLYYVKIEDTPKDITEEIFNTHYARLYPNFTLEELLSMENGIVGWIHEDFVKLDWINYETNKTLDYPFDYEALSNSWRTVDQLVTQIFFEEFNWDVHDAMDFNLEAWEEVKAVANGTIQSSGTWTVKVLHNDWKKSIYAHIVTSENILNWTVKTVTPETVLWTVAPDTTEYKAHLHFELKGENGESLNPAKYFKVYNAEDSHKCMRELVIWEGIYDGEEVKEKCDIGIGNPSKRCQYNWKENPEIFVNCETTPKNCVWHYAIIEDKTKEYRKRNSDKTEKNYFNFETWDEFRIISYTYETNNPEKLVSLKFRFLDTNEIGYLKINDEMDEWIVYVPFTDVWDDNDWYYCSQIKTAKELDWISWRRDTDSWKLNWKFDPTAMINREEWMKVLVKTRMTKWTQAQQNQKEKEFNNYITKYWADNCFPDLEGRGLAKYACFAKYQWWIDWNKLKLEDAMEKLVKIRIGDSWSRQNEFDNFFLYPKDANKYLEFAKHKGIINQVEILNIDWEKRVALFMPEDKLTLKATQKIIANAFKFWDWSYPDNMMSSFTNEPVTRDMYVFFLSKAYYNDRTVDIERIWNCVLHSKETDVFSIRENDRELTWRQELAKVNRLLFVKDSWKENEDGSYVFVEWWWRKSSDEWFWYIKGKFREDFIKYAKEHDDCDTVYRESLLMWYLLEIYWEKWVDEMIVEASWLALIYLSLEASQIAGWEIANIEVPVMTLTLDWLFEIKRIKASEVEIPFSDLTIWDLRLEVSPYMLRKFLHWGADDVWDNKYDNEHWIWKKVIATDFYEKNKIKIKNRIKEGNNYEKLLGWEIIYLDWVVQDGYITDSDSIVSSDFQYSFWLIYRKTSAKMIDGKIFMNIYTKDTYDFEFKKGDSTLDLTYLFNNMWEYLESKWLGTTFDWELDISEDITGEL